MGSVYKGLIRHSITPANKDQAIKTPSVMPTVSGDVDVESQDEVKVFKYEGDEEECEERSSENLTEDKSSLITETEEDKSTHVPSSSSSFAKLDGHLRDTSPFGIFGASAWGAERLSYLSPFAYAYTNGTSAMDSIGLGGPGRPGSPLFSPHLGQPPPAHMGPISPYQLHPKAGLHPSLYPYAASGQYPYHLGADLAAQMAAASWLSPSGLMHPHHRLTPPLTPKLEMQSTSSDHHSVFPYQLNSVGSPRHPSMDQKPVITDKSMIVNKNGEKVPRIKKPLNAFMLYMKETRAQVMAECMLKESAAINQILGRKWHALTREEQAKYYDMARKERQLHMQMYPGWSHRQNYSQGKKKRNRDKTQDEANMKKCRARYGLDQQNNWCKPCRRKKKCTRVMEGEDGDDTAPGSAESHDITAESSDDDDMDHLQDMSLLSPSTHLVHGGDLMYPGDHPMLSPASSSLMSSPGPSLASPSGPPSLFMPSPASLASPLTPGDVRDQQLHQVPQQPPHRTPVGTNPRDINNPLSVNQLTGQCATKPTEVPSSQDNSRPTMVSVT